MQPVHTVGPQAAHGLNDGRQRRSADQRQRGTCASARLWATSERVPSQDGEVTCLMPQTHFMAEPRQDSCFLNHVPIHSTAQGALWDFRGHLNHLNWGHLGRQ